MLFVPSSGGDGCEIPAAVDGITDAIVVFGRLFAGKMASPQAVRVSCGR